MDRGDFPMEISQAGAEKKTLSNIHGKWISGAISAQSRASLEGINGSVNWHGALMMIAEPGPERLALRQINIWRGGFVIITLLSSYVQNLTSLC